MVIKEVFKYAFDVSRNFCFIVVIVQIIALIAMLNMDHTRESLVDEIYDWENPGFLASANIVDDSKQTKPSLSTTKLRINTQSGTLFIFPEEINYIESKSPGSIVHTIYGHRIIASEGIKKIWNRGLIKNSGFFYKTQSYLYNLNQIVHVYSKPDTFNNYQYNIKLKNNIEIPIARDHGGIIQDKVPLVSK